MYKPLFTVIIPIYNSEKYLNYSIKSVLAQTYDNINIILVDDGSKDSCGKICDDYANQYNNIKVIHTENQGLASARNNGLNYVDEGYVVFLDSDDFLDNNMFEIISNVIIELDPDCIDFGLKYLSKDGIETRSLHKIKKNTLLGRAFIKEKILPPLLNIVRDDDNFVFDFSVNKVYKKEILDKYKIRFINGRKVWEDRPFVIDYINSCSSYYCLDECFYYYVDISNSLSRRYTNYFFDVILENYVNYRTKFGKQYDFETQYVYRYWCNSLEKIILWSLRQKEVPLADVKAKIKEIFSNNEIIALYKNRETENKEEKVISELVIDGKIDSMIDFYTKKLAKDERKERYKKYLRKIKRAFTRR